MDLRWSTRHDNLDSRVNALEALVDQWKGARALIYALVGTNVLAVVIGVALLLEGAS